MKKYRTTPKRSTSAQKPEKRYPPGTSAPLLPEHLRRRRRRRQKHEPKTSGKRFSEYSPGRCRDLERSFPRYVYQYESWSKVARSLLSDVDLDAMADAARDEARRRATRPEGPAAGAEQRP